MIFPESILMVVEQFICFNVLSKLFFLFYLKIQLIIIYINQALHFSHAKLQ